jgi:hypothetical protein
MGNPFHQVAVSPSWRSDSAVAIARAAYEGRAFEALPVLADALEEAGCDDFALLVHCRGEGPHFRGCWAVDLLLGLCGDRAVSGDNETLVVVGPVYDDDDGLFATRHHLCIDLERLEFIVAMHIRCWRGPDESTHEEVVSLTSYLKQYPDRREQITQSIAKRLHMTEHGSIQDSWANISHILAPWEQS